MSTNFYWKELQPWFKENAPKANSDEADIFIHIGKRSGAGLYCTKCGTTGHKGGTRQIHFDGPDFSVLIDKHYASKEERDKAWEKEMAKYYYDTCPCCGAKFETENEDKESPIIGVCSFSWTLMKHKELVKELIEKNDNRKVIVNEYNEEFTAKEFFDEIETPIEFQTPWVFS